MASAEDAWVAAFEQCRGSLALFSKAQSAADLAAIKDGWTLCLGAQLCKKDCKKVTHEVTALSHAPVSTAPSPLSPPTFLPARTPLLNGGIHATAVTSEF